MPICLKTEILGTYFYLKTSNFLGINLISMNTFFFIDFRPFFSLVSYTLLCCL